MINKNILQIFIFKLKHKYATLYRYILLVLNKISFVTLEKCGGADTIKFTSTFWILTRAGMQGSAAEPPLTCINETV